ncbi:MAG: YkgJ family cysteine cluster protein [Treponema sp.]|nr:YkgJ family cysteine cluster protein [Treponema sp.]MCL2251501.1 YkgJ family cysteine cluster protein [Treponema sp.]
MGKEPFFAKGLNFSCQRCSACCRYDAGFVFLSETDLEKLTSLLKMERENLKKVYCRWVTDWDGERVLSLKEKANKDCIFWDSGCTVYESRPLQCITFPFWSSIVDSPDCWEVAASGCPGINYGKLHTKEEIDNCIKLRKSQPIINKTGGAA